MRTAAKILVCAITAFVWLMLGVTATLGVVVGAPAISWVLLAFGAACVVFATAQARRLVRRM